MIIARDAVVFDDVGSRGGERGDFEALLSRRIRQE